MDWIRVVRDCFDIDAVLYSRHARFEMENEEFGKILEHEVYESLHNSDYKTDKDNVEPLT